MKSSHPWIAEFRKAFLSGLVLLAPIGVTVFIFVWLINRIGGTMSETFMAVIPEPVVMLPGFELVFELFLTLVVIVLVAAFGWLSRYMLGRYMGDVAEGFMRRLPFAGTIYNTTKEIMDTFSTKRRAIFNKVVLVEFPRRGMYAIGFLTNKTQGEPQARTTEELWTVFIPTTPNPTSGFLVMLPRTDIIEMDMSVGDGMKLIISGGVISPPWQPAPAAGTS